MNLTEEIYNRASALLGELDPKQRMLLHTLSTAANASVTAEVRQDPDVLPCREVLGIAGSLYAAAAYLELDETKNVEQFTVGDVTLHRTNTASGATMLRQQADRMLEPYRSDHFSFRRV